MGCDRAEPYDLGAAGQEMISTSVTLMYVIEPTWSLNRNESDEPPLKHLLGSSGLEVGWHPRSPLSASRYISMASMPFIPYGDPRPDVGAKFPD